MHLLAQDKKVMTAGQAGGHACPLIPQQQLCELLVCGQWWLLPNRGRGIALEMRPNLVGICVWVGEGGLQVSSF